MPLYTCHERLCLMRSMFGIIILHEVVIVLIHTLNKKQEMILKDFSVKFCFHNAIKKAGTGCTIPANSSPHMNLPGMFWAGFITRFLAFLSGAKRSVYLHLYRRLVGPDNIFKTRYNIILLRSSKSLLAVVCTDKLTISCTTGYSAEYITDGPLVQ